MIHKIVHGELEQENREPYLYEIMANSEGVAWTDYSYSPNHVKDFDPNYGYTHKGALHIACDADDISNWARAGRYIPFPPSKLIDLECFFAFQNDYDQTEAIQFRFPHIQNTNLDLYYPAVKYYTQTGKIKFYDSNGNMTEIEDNYKIERFTHWHYFRFVLDLQFHMYKLIQIDKCIKTINAPMHYEGVSTYLNLGKFDFSCVASGVIGQKTEMWIDELKVYDYYRSQGRLD